MLDKGIFKNMQSLENKNNNSLYSFAMLTQKKFNKQKKDKQNLFSFAKPVIAKAIKGNHSNAIINRSSLKKRDLKKNNLRIKQPILRIGDICDLRITALGPNNIGIDEFSYGYSILIPNAKLGEKIKAQIIKINLNKAKYAIAKLIFAENNSVSYNSEDNFKVGTILTVKLHKILVQTNNSSIGIVKFENSLNNPQEGSKEQNELAINHSFAIIKSPLGVKNYQIFIPINNKIEVGQEVQIQITKLKLKYGFAKVLSENAKISCLSKGSLGPGALTTSLHPSVYGSGAISNGPFNLASLSKLVKLEKINLAKITKGSKMTFTLPKNAKKYANYLVMRIRGASNGNSLAKSYILFIKNLLGAKLGDKVRVKFIKIGSSFAIGQILRIDPKSSLIKLTRVRKNLNEMLGNGMHYGEKVVKCQAKMKNFIWNRKKISNSYSYKGLQTPAKTPLINNYTRFQQQTLSLNKNNALIKKGRHLINLLKTRRCLNIGLNQLTKYAAKGRTFLFVGTKKPAAGLIARAALFSKTSFFVNTRWLGGMLTNWKTIIKSISKIRPILKEKQKVISNILQKRSKIQNRLIKKVLSLRKKSKVLIKKGKELIAKVKNTNNTNFNSANSKLKREDYLNKINKKRKELYNRGQFLLEKRQNLLNKQNELKEKTLILKEKGFLIANKYKVLLNQLRLTHTKLHDLRLIYLLNTELRKLKKLAKEQGKNKFILSYGKFKELTTLGTYQDTLKNITNSSHPLQGGQPSLSKKFWVIPNPPQDFLNKLLIKINYSFNYKDAILDSKQRGSLPTFAEARNSKNNNQYSIKEKNTTDGVKLKEISGAKIKLIILTKLLSKFSRFLPYIKNSINILIRIMQNLEKKLTELKNNLKALKTKLKDYILLNTKINNERSLIKTKYLSEQQIIRVLRRKLKGHEAEKKLLQFLPKLRYLPTPKNQISVAIQLLMKRFVDPKMKYPLDLIYDEKLRKKSKKVAAARKKKWQRLETYFGGIANMTKLKKTQISKNVAIIIGQQEEINAIRECKKLGIKMFHIVDTNCNPSLADHFIPANDDSRNSIKYLLSKMVTRIRLAQKIAFNLSKSLV